LQHIFSTIVGMFSLVIFLQMPKILISSL